MGKNWAKHWVFIFFEAVINLFIILDIFFKIKLVGCRDFFRDINNLIDFILGIVILFLFSYCFILQTLTEKYVDEVLETILYVIWFIW
jgi:hypothetical protein